MNTHQLPTWLLVTPRLQPAQSDYACRPNVCRRLGSCTAPAPLTDLKVKANLPRADALGAGQPVLSIRTRLNVLVLVTALPLILFSLAVVVWQSHTARRLTQEQASRTADAAMQTIDRQLAGAITGLQVLAASPALVAGDFKGFHAQARAAVGITGDSVIILYDRDGNRVVSTAVAFGEHVPPRRDMSTLAAPFDTGRPHVTRLFRSETVRKPTVGIVVPVAIGNQVPYVLGAGLLSETLSRTLASTGIPPNWIATVLDDEGTIIARNLNAENAVGRKALPENWSRIANSRETTGTFEGRSQEGTSVLLSFARSSTSGWTTVIGTPIGSLQSQANASLLLILAAGAGVLAAALLLAWSVGRRIYASAARLTDAAQALEEGRFVEVPATGIEQFERLGRAMQSAARAIHERESRLSSSLVELREAHQKLRDEQAEKDRFIATLAHELRNPLAPIRTGVQLLARSPGKEVVDRTLHMMDRQIAHMVRLIDDLLDVSRIARGKVILQPEVAPLQTILADALEASETFFQLGGQRLLVDFPPEPIWVNADRVRIAQVVTNLLSNAAKFTPRDGTVRVAASRQGEDALIEIQDSGVGIPPDRLDEVFKMFAQLQENGEPGPGGLGLGLSIARLLVQLHGGSIEALSEGPGRGATFRIRLPASAPTPSTPPPSSGEQRQGDAARSDDARRVLVVDDNVDAADMLASMLQSAGHEVQVAYDGRHAIDLAQSFPADLVILDIGMPGMNGYEVCAALRALPRYAERKIVALTGWGAPSDREKARDAGFDNHLTKPVDWKELDRLLHDSRLDPRGAKEPQ